MKQDQSVRLATIIVLVIVAIAALNFPRKTWSDAKPRTVQVKKQKKQPRPKTVKKAVRPYADPADLARPGNWHVHRQPVQPKLAQVPHLWLRVSILGNRTYCHERPKAGLHDAVVCRSSGSWQVAHADRSI